MKTQPYDRNGLGGRLLCDRTDDLRDDGMTDYPSFAHGG
jgi:hypothetical protein